MSGRGIRGYISVAILANLVALTGVLSLASCTVEAAPDDYEWVRQFGSTRTDAAWGVAVDGSGTYVVGDTYGTITNQVSMGARDAFISKYDPSGNELWTRQFGTDLDDYAHGVAAYDSGVYAVGITGGIFPAQARAGGDDAYIRRYTSDGSEVWTRQFGSAAMDAASAVTVDASGVYVAGDTEGALPGQTQIGLRDDFVRKYDFDGNELWTHQFGSTAKDLTMGIGVDDSGVYVAGYTEGTFPDQTSSGYADCFIRKYDSNGNEMWTRQFGTASYDYALAIAVHSSSAYVAGMTSGTFPGQPQTPPGSAFVRKYDSSGIELWTRQFTSSSGARADGVAADDSGVYATGYTWGAFPGYANTGELDGYVRKYDPNGEQMWTRQFGTVYEDHAEGIAVGPSGVYVAGYTEGTFPTQSNTGPYDAFVMKMGLDKAPGPLKAVLTGHSAWAAHNHFVMSKHGPDQTLFAKMANIGPGPVTAKVVFTISDSPGNFVAEVHSDVARIPAGEKTTVQGTWSVQPGSYDVTAQCWFDSDDDGSFDGRDPDMKAFSFDVVP